MTMKAPAGPPIWALVPPRAEIRKPAMMAVHSPAPGGRPLAIANAMASGFGRSCAACPAAGDGMQVRMTWQDLGQTVRPDLRRAQRGRRLGQDGSGAWRPPV